MERNTFFARFLVTNSHNDNEGEGYVVEQYFTTDKSYVIEPPAVQPSPVIGNSLGTVICKLDPRITDTSNGLLFYAHSFNGKNWPSGYLTVGFDVVENGTQFPTLDNLKVAFYEKEGPNGFNAVLLPEYFVSAYAIGTIGGLGNINSSTMNRDSTVWITGTDRKPGGTLKPGLIRSNKFDGTVAFNRPSHLPFPMQVMEEYQFVRVSAPVVETPVAGCCDNQANSLALVAAASLIASNNATSPLLIKQIEKAVSNAFDATSTISALQNMRQLGTLSNVAGKVLDNAIPKSNDVVIITNGPQE